MSTREEWLNEAAGILNGWLAEHTDLKPAKKVLVSVGWPHGGRAETIGQCFTRSGGSGSNHVFISPVLSTATEVLPVLLHELIHAADDCEHHHMGAFRKAWKALGFEGKPTCSTPGSELKAELKSLAGQLGKYPHKKLLRQDRVKQGTRQLKVECQECGCIVRMTRKWLDAAGEPTCGCGGKMVEDDA